MFATFDIDAALTDYEFESGMIEKIIDSAFYKNAAGDIFAITFIATTNAKYARVIVDATDEYELSLGAFGGAIRHYLYTSAKASGPIRGRKIITTNEYNTWVNSDNYASIVEYIIDNPFYNAK